MEKRSSIAGAAVEFRDLIRNEADKKLREVDQVSLAVVSAVDGVDVDVLLDEMSIPVPTMWAVPTDPVVGERVVTLAMRGAQQFITIAKIRDPGT